ncbi:contractile injection system tape measure protein [Enterobacter roggenkampii]|uniref:contractile injection system tape measure protein n=1 Tax=Enterobacter roggenkampii TaxID=1812935 RepID=UPI002DBA2E10|nr:contractile injection system tape measure protein [Enterobacter roggenkampii]MEB5890004.1 contractile injection system tape measure protein [Enterobacter roggenkampii]
MSEHHHIHRLRLILHTDYQGAPGLTARTRRLFNQRLRGMLETLFQQHASSGRDLQAGQVVIDLGGLPETHFEEAFCQRLMQRLPAILRQHLREASPGGNPALHPDDIFPVIPEKGQGREWSAAGAGQQHRFKRPASAGRTSDLPAPPRTERSDNARTDTGSAVPGSGGRRYGGETDQALPSCGQVMAKYIRTAIWDQTVSPDRWLSERLAQQPASLRLLAEICLQMPGLGLPGRFFAGSTLRLLISRLAPGASQQQPVSPAGVLLAALHWYQRHSTIPVPVFSQPEDWPVMRIPDADAANGLSALTRPELAAWRRVMQDGRLFTVPLPGGETGRPAAALSGTPAEKASPDAGGEATASRSAKAGHISASGVRVSGPAGGRHLVSGAGLSLLWPLLPELLQITGIRQPDTEMDDERRVEAAILLAYLVTGEVCGTLPCTLLSHALCGVSPAHTQTIVPLSAARSETVDEWLQTLPERIPGWQRLSGQDIRILFLQREGWLCPDSHTLYLPPQPADVLLSEWPWPLTILLLPWLQAPLTLSLSLPPQK